MAAAVAAAAAFISANAVAISLAVSIVSVGLGIYQARKARASGAVPQAERKQTLRSATASKNWLYGENISASLLSWVHEQPGNQTDGEQLTLVLSHAGCPIDRVTDVFYNDELSTNFDNPGTIVQYPQGRTSADPFLLGLGSTTWQSDMIGRDVAWGRFTLNFDQANFPTGVPNITVRKFGRRVLDPRNPSAPAAYSDNPALCWYDYVRNHPSLKMTDDDILIDTVISAANICDQMVDRHDSQGNVTGTEKRFTITAEFELNEDPSEVIDAMLAACGGEVIRFGGLIGIHVGAYYGPTTLTLNEDDIIGAVPIQTEASREDAFNVVRGVYNSKTNNFTETDYPEVRFTDWITEDGEEIPENLDLRFVNSPSQAQRVADIYARRARFGMILELPCNMRGLNYPPGCTFNLNLRNIGLENVECKVIGWGATTDSGVTLIVRRDLASYYGQQLGQDVVLPPVLNVPSTGVAAPSNVQFVTTIIGDVVQGQLTWQNTNLRINRTEVVIYRVTDDGQGGTTETIVQTASVPFPGTLIDLNGKVTGNYRAALRAFSVTGAPSSETSFTFTIAAPVTPDSVTVERSNWNLLLIPNYAAGVQIPENVTFQFFYLADPASFIGGVPTFGSGDLAQAELIHTGSTFNHGGLIPDRYQHYWVRAVNAYGQSAVFYVQTGTTNDSGLVTTVLERLVAIEVQSQNWNPDSTNISDVGYKLYSNATGSVTLPDGTVLTQPDGLAVFNNIVARGQIFATSGSITNRLTVGNGYIDGRTAQDFINMGNGQFRVTHAGRLIANNADIRGTVTAESIVGDIVTALRLSAPDRTANSVAYQTFDTVRILTARPYARTLIMSCVLEARVTVGDFEDSEVGTTEAQARATGSFGTVNSPIIATTAASGPGQNVTTTNTLNVQLVVNVPANVTGTMTLQVRRVSNVGGGAGVATLKGQGGTNWTAQLFRNGSDLGS